LIVGADHIKEPENEYIKKCNFHTGHLLCDCLLICNSNECNTGVLELSGRNMTSMKCTSVIQCKNYKKINCNSNF